MDNTQFTIEHKACELPKVSILMSVYNGEATLAAAIDSILSQTFTDYELIVCDDASTDGSWQILLEYCEKDPRIIAFHNESNHGLGASLNRCMERSRGTYIARQDADDKSEPTRIERTLAYLEAHDLPYAGCGVYVFDDDGVWSRRVFPECIDKHIIAKKNPFFHPTMIFRREVLEGVGGYRETKTTRRAEDYDLVMRLAARNIIGKNLQEYLYYVYEPATAYLRHTCKTRLNEVSIRWAGLHEMHAPLKDYVYLAKPIIMMLIPRSLFRTIKKVQWRTDERKA